eukprot:7137989-Pyramimonas_sp.AAC.1
MRAAQLVRLVVQLAVALVTLFLVAQLAVLVAHLANPMELLAGTPTVGREALQMALVAVRVALVNQLMAPEGRLVANVPLLVALAVQNARSRRGPP